MSADLIARLSSIIIICAATRRCQRLGCQRDPPPQMQVYAGPGWSNHDTDSRRRSHLSASTLPRRQSGMDQPLEVSEQRFAVGEQAAKWYRLGRQAALDGLDQAPILFQDTVTECGGLLHL